MKREGGQRGGCGRRVCTLKPTTLEPRDEFRVVYSLVGETGEGEMKGREREREQVMGM